MHRISGRFIQEDYGFSVLAPEPWGGYVTNGDDANHGMVVVFGDRRSIDIFPEYTDGEGLWGIPCGPKLSVGEPASRGVEDHARLGGLPACEVAFANRDAVWRVIQARRGSGSDIVYTMILRTNRQNLGADETAFDQIAHSCKRVRITP